MEPEVSSAAAPEPGLPEDYTAYAAAREAQLSASEAEDSAIELEVKLPAAEETKPESEPGPGEGEAGQDRDEQGKFKAKEPDVPAGVQKRIDRVVAQREAERRRADDLERRLAEANRGAAPAEVKAEKPVADAEPKEDQFETYEAFTRAAARWEAKQEAKQLVEAEFTKAREDHQRQLAEQGEARAKQSWQGQVEEGRKRYEDFDEIMEVPAPITPAMRQLILTSEHGADVAYYLGRYPEVAERLSELHPVAAAREIGRLEAQLVAVLSKSAPEPAKPAASRAPKPPAPIGRVAAPLSSSVYDEKLADNYPAWERARNRDLASR